MDYKTKKEIIESNPYYYVLKDYDIEETGLIFFSVENVRMIQDKIKQIIYKLSNVILTEDQDVNSLLIVMRDVYLREGRFLRYKITQQVEDLNIKLLNRLIPDILTGVKQQLGYLKYINSPIDPMDRPINNSIKGSKTTKEIGRFIKN